LKAPRATNHYTTINPNLGIQYQIRPHLKMHTSLGTAFSVPDAYKTAGCYAVATYFPEWDFWWREAYVGNPQLKPETSSSADIGLKYNKVDKGLQLGATYFYTYHHRKIIEYTRSDGKKSFKNAHHSIMDGLELNASYNVGALFSPRLILEIYANYTYLFHANCTQKLAEAAEQTALSPKIYPTLESQRSVRSSPSDAFRMDSQSERAIHWFSH
jgi:outer membrane receptor protein involved in Fe transport